MGDRANWGFAESIGKPIINLYTHWHGYEQTSLLVKALEKARPRWSDPAYATRIAISTIVGDEHESLTGWGISVDSLPDNEHSYYLVYWEEQAVVKIPLNWEQGMETVKDWSTYEKAEVWKFETFIRKHSAVGVS